jgi:hypothetical protein
MPTNKTSPKASAKKRSAAEIAEAAMPGWKAVPNEEDMRTIDASTSVPPDAALPSLAQLRKKYLGDVDNSVDLAPEHMAALDDTEVVTMTAGPLKKKVGIKGDKVVWYQG